MARELAKRAALAPFMRVARRWLAALPALAKLSLAGLLVTMPMVVGAADDRPALTGTVVVLNKGGDDASFIDLASGRIVATAPTGVGPHELVISADGRLAIGTDYEGGKGTLSVFDVEAGERIRVIDLAPWRRPHGIVFLPGDEVVAVTAEADRAVLLVRVRDGELLASLPTAAAGSHMVAVTADGNTLWTGDIGNDTVTQLSVATRKRVLAVAVPDEPEAINVTPSGDRVFVGSNSKGLVTVLDTRAGTKRTIADGFGWPYRMFLTPDLTQLIVPDLRREELRFIDLQSYEELGRIAFPGGAPQGLALHEDGRHLFLSLSARDRVAIVDVQRRQVVGELPAGRSPDGIAYSPRLLEGR